MSRPTVRFGNALEQLKSRANFTPVEKMIKFPDGATLSVWVKPLTVSERNRAMTACRRANNDDTTDWSLYLVAIKALDESGDPLFSVAELKELKDNCLFDDVQALIQAVSGTSEAEVVDVKKSSETSETTQKPA